MKQSPNYLKLHVRIIKSRIILNQLVHEFGLDHPKVLQYSRKMDKLVTQMQKQKELASF